MRACARACACGCPAGWCRAAAQVHLLWRPRGRLRPLLRRQLGKVHPGSSMHPEPRPEPAATCVFARGRCAPAEAPHFPQRSAAQPPLTLRGPSGRLAVGGGRHALLWFNRQPSAAPTADAMNRSGWAVGCSGGWRTLAPCAACTSSRTSSRSSLRQMCALSCLAFPLVDSICTESRPSAAPQAV